MTCCEVSDCAQMSKTIIAGRHFELGGRELLETAVMHFFSICLICQKYKTSKQHLLTAILKNRQLPNNASYLLGNQSKCLKTNVE